jgi:hypothetical protein
MVTSPEVRFVPPLNVLEADTRARIEGQRAVALRSLVAIFERAGVSLPKGYAFPRVAPFGCWFSTMQFGDCDHEGVVTILAAGQKGIALGEAPDRPGRDVRGVGLAPSAWATVLVHELAHAAHALDLGLGLAFDVMTLRPREPGQEPDTFARYVGWLNERLTGSPLPGDATDQWPRHAPGMAPLVHEIAEQVAPFVLPPLGEVPPLSDEDATAAFCWEAVLYRQKQTDGARAWADLMKAHVA